MVRKHYPTMALMIASATDSPITCVTFSMIPSLKATAVLFRLLGRPSFCSASDK